METLITDPMTLIPAWIEELASGNKFHITILSFIVVLATSILASVFVKILYAHFFRNYSIGAQIHRSFLLLGPSIASLFFTIQFSLFLALGLFGVFSMIRFRNPVRDPEEMGYLMLVLASAVFCATFQFHLLGIFFILMTGALVIQKFIQQFIKLKKDDGYEDGLYIINMKHETYTNCEDQLRHALHEHVTNGTIRSFSYNDGTITTQCQFSGEKKTSRDKFIESLQMIAPILQFNVVFSEAKIEMNLAELE